MIICVTGPMASGKNAVCTILESMGFLSIDADKEVHRAIDMSRDRILQEFGTQAQKLNIVLTNADGSINRKALGKLLFSSPDLLQKQENIVYPVITENILHFISQNPGKNIILNATVLYKTPGLQKLCACIVYVTAPEIKRFFRSLKRDKMPAKQILKRFKSQRGLKKLYKKTGLPLITINNTGSLKKLNKKVTKAYQLFYGLQ